MDAVKEDRCLFMHGKRMQKMGLDGEKVDSQCHPLCGSAKITGRSPIRVNSLGHPDLGHVDSFFCC